MSAMSDGDVTELRLPKAVPSKLAREGTRGTGGMAEPSTSLGEPMLALRSRKYMLLCNGCSPRGNVAESWRVIPPDLYLDARES